MTETRRSDRAAVWVVALVSFALRVTAIDVPLNMDESLWVQRGGVFVSALLDGEPGATYVRPHPGVTTMWLVGASAALGCVLENASSLRVCAEELVLRPFPPLRAYLAARLAQAVLTSLLLAWLYVLSRLLFGSWVARLALAFLTFEPFFLGYQRFITTDALASDLCAVALLLLLLHLRGDGGRGTLLASGCVMGLAVVTKVPVLLALPAVALWIVLIERGAWAGFEPRGWTRRAADLSTFAAALLATVVLVWPALWVGPLEVAGRLLGDLRSEAGGRPHFFLGGLSRDPGPLYYPLALAYRLSPILWAGLVLCLGAAFIPAARRRVANVGELTALALLALGTLGALTLAGATKFDRYLLPTVPALALLSAAGWKQVARGAAAPLALAAGQFLLLAPHFPYCLTYFNPLLGGPSAAQRVLMLGQGEGLDQAAAWLNRLPGVESMTAASGDAPAFAPYFKGRTLWIPYGEGPTPGPWAHADWLVLYVTQFQLGIPNAEWIRRFAAERPAHTVRLHGIDYARIYPGLARPSPTPGPR